MAPPRQPTDALPAVRQAPTEILIDTASCFEIFRVLSRPADANDSWAWKTARAVTSLLLFSDRLLLPTPPTGVWFDPVYAMFRRQLADSVGSYTATHSAASATRARRWASVDRLEPIIIETQGQDGYDAWLDWYIGTWPDHVSRHGGIFDARFLVNIARAMGVMLKDARLLHERWSEPQAVERLVTAYRRGKMKDEVALLGLGWLIACLIRSRYYDALAEEAGLQVSHHPVRKFVFRDAHDHIAPFVTDRFENYLANIVLASALVEKRHNARVQLFAHNIRAIRNASRPVRVPRKTLLDDETALSAAVEEARRLGITVYPRFLEHMVALSLSGAAATVVFFSPHVSDYYHQRSVSVQTTPWSTHGRLT